MIEETAEAGSLGCGHSGIILARFEQRNKFSVGESLEIMKPDGQNITAVVEALYTEEGEPVESCPHARQRLWVKLSQPVEPYDLLRRETKDKSEGSAVSV